MTENIKCSLVMLPTTVKKAGLIHKLNDTLIIPKGHELMFKYPTTMGVDWVPQHLYVLSDEEIKEGDWAMNVISNEICKSDGEIHFNAWKKIIATTNPELRINYPCIQCDGTGETTFSGTYSSQKKCDLCSQLKYPNTKSLPRPSDRFIQLFVKELNKGYMTSEINIEFDVFNREIISPDTNKAESIKDLKLRVLPNNTIIARFMGNSWDEFFKEINDNNFEGWSEDQVNAYNTCRQTIIEKAKQYHAPIKK